MASRRSSRILILFGVILLAAGPLSILYGVSPGYANTTAPIGPGWENYNQFQWAVLAGGSVQGTWQSLNGTPVEVFLYNDAQYGAYVSGSNLTGLYHAAAVNGTISLSVSGFDTYHVVIQHAPGYEDTYQEGSVDLMSTGADPTFTLGGVAAMVIGALLVVYAVRRSRRLARQPAAGPQWDTFEPSPPPPAGRSPSSPEPGAYRVPPPLPGDSAGPGSPSAPRSAAPGPARPPASSADADTPVGTVVVTVENRAATDATLDLVVNGAAVTSMTVGAGQSRPITVSARLSSPFGSTVTVEAVLAGGRRTRESVFVGARGTAAVTLHVG